jgi:hypothetical protein
MMNGLKTATIEIEKWVAKYVGNEAEAARRLPGGEKLANEIVASVAALFMARAVGIIHIWTGESVDSIRKRVVEAFDANLKETIRKLKNPS